MHPDQYTSDEHRYKAPDSDAEDGGEATPDVPEISERAEAETTRAADTDDDAGSTDIPSE